VHLRGGSISEIADGNQIEGVENLPGTYLGQNLFGKSLGDLIDIGFDASFCETSLFGLSD
jgi:hypothetical protein